MPEGLIYAAFQLPARGVKVVLDAVVAAALHLLRDLSPPIAQALVLRKDKSFLLSVDRVFLDRRVQVIVPSVQSKSKRRGGLTSRDTVSLCGPLFGAL